MVLKHDITHEPSEQDEELFAAFVNTLEFTRGVPEDHVPEIDRLLEWLRSRDLISGRARAAESGRLRRQPAEAARRMQRFRRLRDVLRALITDLVEEGGPNPSHVGELNHILRHGLHFHQLRHDPAGSRYEVAQLGDRLDQARATIASSFAHFLADGEPDRLRICDNEGCRYVFVDRSPSGRRRWCDMRTCGNQATVAAHRARQRAGVEAETTT
jgi:predicted RNA-binding Zn ribbon-like protein